METTELITVVNNVFIVMNFGMNVAVAGRVSLEEEQRKTDKGHLPPSSQSKLSNIAPIANRKTNRNEEKRQIINWKQINQFVSRLLLDYRWLHRSILTRATDCHGQSQLNWNEDAKVANYTIALRHIEIHTNKQTTFSIVEFNKLKRRFVSSCTLSRRVHWLSMIGHEMTSICIVALHCCGSLQRNKLYIEV